MVKTKEGVTAANLTHPNSRKFHRLKKQVKKEETRKQSKMAHLMKQNIMGEKFIWFRDNLPEGVSVLTRSDIEILIERYLKRFDEELEQIKLKHSIGQRKNRQHASREDTVILSKKQEKEEYETAGIELPNLLQASQVELLSKWNGELRFLQNFKLKRFSQSILRKDDSKKRPSSPNHQEVPENIEMDVGDCE